MNGLLGIIFFSFVGSAFSKCPIEKFVGSYIVSSSYNCEMRSRKILGMENILQDNRIWLSPEQTGAGLQFRVSVSADSDLSPSIHCSENSIQWFPSSSSQRYWKFTFLRDQINFSDQNSCEVFMTRVF